MGQNQPMQTNPPEQFVQIPMNNNNEKHSSMTLINQTGTSNRRSIIIIIICVIFVITGQSIARLLETFHHHHTNRSLHDGLWTQPLIQVIGFPLLILPFFLLSSKKHNQPLITSDPSSLAVLYLCTGVIMVVHVRLYVKGKLELSFPEFLLLDGTQLYFTMIFAGIIKKFKFNQWFFISLIFTIAVVAIATLSSNVSGQCAALLSAVTFSFLLCHIQSIFNKRKAIFANVLELVIFSSLFATVTAVFISSGETHDLKREIDGFSKGKIVYVLTVIGQVAAWQIYWVGIVGVVVFTESIVTANVISVTTIAIVKALNILFCNYEEEEFDGFLVASLALFTVSVAACFYKPDFANWKMPRLLQFLVLFVVYYFYIFELLESDPYISSPMEVDFF